MSNINKFGQGIGLVPQTVAPTNPVDGTMYYDAAADKVFVSVNGTWVAFDSNADNFISNSNPDIDLTGYAAYANAAGIAPTTGTGGSPTVTVTRSTTNPLAGAASILYTKGSSSKQGQGFSYDFTINRGQRGQILTMNYLAELVSGTYNNGTGVNDSDLLIYIYDITNSRLIAPSAFKVILSTAGQSVVAQPLEFQTSIDSTSYRMIIHQASATASAFVVKFGNFSVGPTQKGASCAITQLWTDYTPIITAASGALTNYTLSETQWMRDGENVYLKGKLAFTGAVGTWNSPYVPLPSGLNLINPSQIAPIVSEVSLIDTGVQTYAAKLATVSGASSYLSMYIFGGASSASGSITNAIPFSWGSGDIIKWETGPIKIAEWVGSSTTIASQPGINSEVMLQAGSNSNQAVTANVTDIIFSNTIKDTTGSWNGTTTYKVPVNGDYIFCFCAYLSSGGAGINVYKNGASDVGVAQLATVRSYASRVVVGLKAGDLITFRADSAVTIGSGSFFSIQKLANPQQIAASAKVACSYSSTTATSVANTGVTVIPFPSKEEDTHNAYNTSTGIWTCPAPGTYSIKVQIAFNSAAYAASNYADIQIFKNGNYCRAGGVTYVQAAGTYFLYPGAVTVDLPFIAGDTIQFKAENIRTGGATVLSGSSGGNYMSISRIG